MGLGTEGREGGQQSFPASPLSHQLSAGPRANTRNSVGQLWESIPGRGEGRAPRWALPRAAVPGTARCLAALLASLLQRLLAPSAVTTENVPPGGVPPAENHWITEDSPQTHRPESSAGPLARMERPRVKGRSACSSPNLTATLASPHKALKPALNVSDCFQVT